MQVAAEDEHVATDGCAAGEGEIAAEDQNVARHRPVEKNVSRENTHAAGGVSLHLGGTEKAAGIVNCLVRCNHNVPMPKWRTFGLDCATPASDGNRIRVQRAKHRGSMRAFPRRTYAIRSSKLYPGRSDKAVSGSGCPQVECGGMLRLVQPKCAASRKPDLCNRPPSFLVDSRASDAFSRQDLHLGL